MNKKQLIVAWIIGILICGVIASAPKIYLAPAPGGGYAAEKSPQSYTITKLDWSSVLQRSLIIFILGSLLIYSLRNKQ